MIEITEAIESIGIPYPNPAPHEDITFVAVAWNEERRAEALLNLAAKWFSRMVIGVQESTDQTLSIAQRYASPTNQIVKHQHYGFGDASMPDLISRAKTPWVFVVAFDEIPDVELLQSLHSAVTHADRKGIDGIWIPFHSIVEGVGYNEQHGHLRLFRSSLGWPKKLHARPQGTLEAWWPHGHIAHERSLDEMMQDYLRYYELGKGDKGWDAHNKIMMHDACMVIAQHKGPEFVKAFEWWPQVRKITGLTL